MRRILLFIVFFILPSKTSLKSENNKTWDKVSVLSWDDFLGNVEMNSSFDANTDSGDTIRYQWKHINGQLSIDFDGWAIMNREKSWVRTDKKSDRLLRHEHFDISEYFFKQHLKALHRFPFTENFRNEIDFIQEEVNKHRRMMQDLYDEETMHSQNLKMQVLWELYIKELVEKNYSLEYALKHRPTTTL